MDTGPFPTKPRYGFVTPRLVCVSFVTSRISVKDILDQVEGLAEKLAPQALALFRLTLFGLFRPLGHGGVVSGPRPHWRGGWPRGIAAQRLHLMKRRAAGAAGQFVPLAAGQNQRRAGAAIAAGRDFRALWNGRLRYLGKDAYRATAAAFETLSEPNCPA